MLAFQCKDGGWAAFDKDCTKNVLTKVPFADHNAMLDPECADITARILEVLGHERFPLNHLQVVKAIEYLRRSAGARRFVVRTLGRELPLRTWQVLRGLHTLGSTCANRGCSKARLA